MLALKVVVFFCIVRLGMTTNEGIFFTDDAYAYDDSYAESYSDYSYGYADYNESREEEPEPYSVPSAETVPDDDNCMGLEGYLMTEELKSCCTLLESDSIYNTTMKNQTEKCMALQMQHMYGISDNDDYTEDVASRSSKRRKCPFSGKYKLIKLLCCSYRSCSGYESVRLKKVCRRCSKICKKVTCQRSLYHE